MLQRLKPFGYIAAAVAALLVAAIFLATRPAPQAPRPAQPQDPVAPVTVLTIDDGGHGDLAVTGVLRRNGVSAQ